MYVIIWSFKIRKESKEEFEKAYGPDGTWARFFKSGKGYLQTELLCDSDERDRYVTIDRWASQSDYERFRNENKSEYGNLDRRFETWTLEEQCLGSFTSKE